MGETRKAKENKSSNRVLTTMKNYDWLVLIIIGILLLFGLIMLYSTSSYSAQIKYSDGLYYVKKQLFAIVLGIVLMIVVSLFTREFLKKAAIWVYALGLLTVFLVKTSIGVTSHGASRWISVGGLSFQPSELIKIGVVLFTAFYICKFAVAEEERRRIIKNKENTSFTRQGIRELEQLKQNQIKEELKHLAISLGGSIIAAMLVIVLTDDLGTAIIIFAIGFVMIFVTNKHKGTLIIVLIVIAAIAVIYVLSSDFRMDRIRAWLRPEDYTTNESYQITQGLYAIGSGGLVGKGLGMSTQKLDYLPESQNDMIFSIICEELGIIGGIVLIILFAFLIWKMKTVFDRSNDMFDKMIVVGVCTHIAVQSFINIAVVTGTIPNTGVPLPFISYGGTAVSLQLAEIGLIMGVSARNTEGIDKTIEFKNKGPDKKPKKQKGAYNYQ